MTASDTHQCHTCFVEPDDLQGRAGLHGEEKVLDRCDRNPKLPCGITFLDRVAVSAATRSEQAFAVTRPLTVHAKVESVPRL
jgi:hypothetical protein